jgi:hypothetical protein
VASVRAEKWQQKYAGWVQVVADDNTAGLVVESIRHWWYGAGLDKHQPPGFSIDPLTGTWWILCAFGLRFCSGQLAGAGFGGAPMGAVTMTGWLWVTVCRGYPAHTV